MRTADFDYALPPELIAQTPPPQRADARLLVLRRAGGGIEHRRIGDLPQLLSPGDLLVLNDTRVLPARLRAWRASGGAAEILLLHPWGPEGQGLWSALVRPARRLRPGERLVLRAPGERTGADGGGVGAGAEPAPAVRLVQRGEHGEAVVGFEDLPAGGMRAVLQRYGEVPLPPYIRSRLADAERYQTVYARAEGSAAAPTAGLHFTPELFTALEAAGIGRTALTLHVGLGTFRPVTAERAEEHRLHSEWFELGPRAAADIAAARARGGRVVAVGTTAVRTLETQAAAGGGAVVAGSGWTDLYLLPGRPFLAVDALLTNFHLPKSTLLMLVCAFGGTAAVLAAYREAVRLRYRFFSFGDAMLVL